MIQANAYSEHGGNVLVNVDSLIASQKSVNKSRSATHKMEFERTRIECDPSRITIWISDNAPVTSPQLNLSGMLIGLNAVFFGYDYSVKIIAMLGQEVH